MSAQLEGRSAPKRPFTTDVPRSGRGKALHVGGLALLGIGIACALVAGWVLAMWAFEDHGRSTSALVAAIIAFSGFLIAALTAGVLLASASRADRTAAGVEEPPRMEVWTAVRTGLRQRPLP